MKKTTAKTSTHDKPELYKSYNDEESYDFPDYEDPDHDVISSRNNVVKSRNYVTDHRDDVMNSKNGGGRRGQPFHSRQKRKCRSDDYYDDVIQRCLHCETVCSPKFKMKLDCPECPDYKPSEMSSFHLPNQATTLKNTSKSEVFLATTFATGAILILVFVILTAIIGRKLRNFNERKRKRNIDNCEEKLTAPYLANGEICSITDISRQKYDVINHNINYDNVNNNSTKLTYPVNQLFKKVIVKTIDRYGPNFNNNDNINSSNNNKNNIICKYNNFEHANNINANIANNNNNNNNNSSPNNINNKIINNNITNKNNINTNNNINNNNNNNNNNVNNNNNNNNNFAIVDNNATSSLDFNDSYYSLHSDVIVQGNNKNNKNNNKSNNKNNNNNRCCNDCDNNHNHNNYKII